MTNQMPLREFEALVARTGSDDAAFRTSVRARDLDDATNRLAELYGRERILSVWNEEDANKPRGQTVAILPRNQHEL